MFGLHGKGLVAGVLGKSLCEKRPRVSQYLTVTFPAGSKHDLLLPKTEPLSNTGGATVITYLRKDKRCCAAAVKVRVVREM